MAAWHARVVVYHETHSTNNDPTCLPCFNSLKMSR
ncbi:uncharacterized protein G2W53_013316 [Senna tora]|uniref:Uncharacterized protein n=1 Tax=Senna tora TaxID=362788 RepID=A0A834TY83_9FABA|nr:uncharacterized protein G2W53_013316 [Senna tora]